MNFLSRGGVLLALSVSFLFGGSVVLAADSDLGGVPATGPAPGQPGYDPTNFCENQWKYQCKDKCTSGDISEPQISCGKKAGQGMSKCCHAKNFASGPVGPTSAGQAKTNAAGKTTGELSGACAQAGGVCQATDPDLTAQGITPCSGDQQLVAFCSADGSSVCCTKAAAAVNTQVGACIKAGGSCSVGSCPAGSTSVGVCDSLEDAYCCVPEQGVSAADIPINPAKPNEIVPPPNPFDDKKPAGFDKVKSYYGFQDPLNLQGTNKFPKLINRIISWALPLTGSMFLIVIIYSGVLWMSAAGNEKQISKAKTYLTNAVIGMMLIVFSYAIVINLINYFGNAAFGPGGS